MIASTTITFGELDLSVAPNGNIDLNDSAIGIASTDWIPMGVERSCSRAVTAGRGRARPRLGPRTHVWVTVVGRGDEGFLMARGAGPAQEVLQTAGLSSVRWPGRRRRVVGRRRRRWACC